MRKLLWPLLFFIALFTGVECKAQKEKTEIRHFDTEKIDSFKGNRDFQYGEVPLIDRKRNAWQQFKRWLYKLIQKAILDEKSNGRWVLYVLLTFAVVFVILKLLKVNFTFFLGKKDKKIDDVGFEEIIKNLHTTNFDTLIQEAKSNQEWTRAVALYYLGTLQKLSEHKKIQHRYYKTNREYLKELKKYTPLSGDFEKLTQWFEYVCYGNFLLQADDFVNVEASFLQFYQKISAT